MDFDAAAEVGKLLNTEPAKELLSPASREIGGLLGDIANMTRFYATRNLENIFTKWARSRPQGKIIEATDFERVMPLLPAASMQSDDELQDRWVALLESATTRESAYLPSFGQTLSQITAEEARFLDKLWGFVTHLHPDQPIAWMRPLEEMQLVELCDSVDTTRPYLVIADLVRLGILEREPTVDPASRYTLDHYTMKIEGETVLYFQYSVTQYGVSFMLSVQTSESEKSRLSSTE